MNKEKKLSDESSQIDETEFEDIPVVGIGASAGGLEALEKLFLTIPADTGLAFVIIQHLDPDHKSVLSDLMRRYTEMKVLQIEDGVIIQANTVYIIPPGADLSLKGNKLLLSPRSKVGASRLAIDGFFTTLAHEKKDKAIGIILSGTGTDGTLGVRAIKSENGIVFVQNPKNAKYDGMPVSAISTGIVDHILDADKILEKLISYIKYLFDVTGTVAIPDGYSNNLVEHILKLISTKLGHDFSQYKRTTIARRIERRMKICQIDKIENYLTVLKKNQNELNELFKDFLIGVTHFFRDIDAFNALKDQVIPEVFRNKIKDRPLRIWIPGCSTGEEAFTIAILLKDHLDKNGITDHSIQVFATDIDENAIKKARQATFPESISEDIPENYLHNYFSLQKNVYVVNKPIRDLVVFAEQSVIRDPPFSNIDLISCRNLLIYLTSELQEKVISAFHYSLAANGYLFLGSSETLGKSSNLFTTKDKKWKLYKKQEISLSQRNARTIPSFSPAKLKNEELSMKLQNSEKLSLSAIMDKEILAHFTPAAVLVNDKKDIIYLKGNTSAYLEPVQGIANMNLVEMAKPDIRTKLSFALSNAIRETKNVRVGKLHILNKGTKKFINIDIKHIPKEASNLYLVVFEDITEKEHFSESNLAEVSDENIHYLRSLEVELKQTQEYLQAEIADADTTNEELKTTNEELHSANEELQSTNEELETSKEELQSINEELTTVNAEHQNKITELSDINNDINNILTNTEIAIIFLDLELKIKKFTPRITDFIDLIPSDINRPIQNFVTKLNYPEFHTDLQHVVNTLNNIDKEIESYEKSYICRMKPYRTLENVVTGVVITFLDVSNLKMAQRDLKNTLQELKFHIENTPLAVVAFNSNLQLTQWSLNAEKLFGWRADEVLGKSYREFPWVFEQDADRAEIIMNDLLNHKKTSVQVVSRNNTKNGSVLTCQWSTSALFDDSDNLISLHSFVLDITEKEKMAQELEQSEAKYRQLFEKSPESVIIHDLEMNIIDVNERAIQLFGYSKEEFLQIKVFDLHPKEELNRSEKVLGKVKKEGSSKVKAQFVTKKGGLFKAGALPSKCFFGGREVIQVLIKNPSEVK
ncbi:MAG: chemotaxis protein CheB [Cyclobacteriaceae bacterium]